VCFENRIKKKGFKKPVVEYFTAVRSIIILWYSILGIIALCVCVCVCMHKKHYRSFVSRWRWKKPVLWYRKSGKSVFAYANNNVPQRSDCHGRRVVRHQYIRYLNNGIIISIEEHYDIGLLTFNLENTSPSVLKKKQKVIIFRLRHSRYILIILLIKNVKVIKIIRFIDSNIW